MKMLLNKDAEVNAQGGRFGNALYAASSEGHEKVMEILQEWQLLTTLRIQTLKRAIQADSGDCARKKKRMDMPAPFWWQ